MVERENVVFSNDLNREKSTNFSRLPIQPELTSEWDISLLTSLENVVPLWESFITIYFLHMQLHNRKRKTFLTSIFLSIDDNSVFSPFVRAQNACNNTWKMEIFSCKGPNQGCYTFLNETMATYLEIFGDFILQGVGFSVDQWLARKSSLFQFVQWYFIFWLFKALSVVWCLILFLKL